MSSQEISRSRDVSNFKKFKRLKIQEDEQKRLDKQFKLKFDEQKRQYEQGRADAYQAKKDAEPGFVGSLFGK